MRELATRMLRGEGWRRKSEELRRSGLARVTGQWMGRWTLRLAQQWADPEPPRGRCFAAQGLTRGGSRCLGALCKAWGCFSGTKSKALSSGVNCLPDQPGEVAGGANSRLLPPGAREMSKRISSGQLSRQLSGHGRQPSGRQRLGLTPSLHLSLPSLAPSWFWGPGDPHGWRSRDW